MYINATLLAWSLFLIVSIVMNELRKIDLTFSSNGRYIIPTIVIFCLWIFILIYLMVDTFNYFYLIF
jgi:hypothetical protein